MKELTEEQKNVLRACGFEVVGQRGVKYRHFLLDSHIYMIDEDESIADFMSRLIRVAFAQGKAQGKADLKNKIKQM